MQAPMYMMVDQDQKLHPIRFLHDIHTQPIAKVETKLCDDGGCEITMNLKNLRVKDKKKIFKALAPYDLKSDCTEFALPRKKKRASNRRRRKHERALSRFFYVLGMQALQEGRV